jgi:hypothetical protein
MLLLIDRLNAIARSVDCDGVTIGVVNVVLLLIRALPLVSTPPAFITSAPIHTCWRCAANGVKT